MLPKGEVGYFGPDELEVLVLLQLGDDLCENVLGLVLEIPLECLDPARVVVGVGHQEDLQLVLLAPLGV